MSGKVTHTALVQSLVFAAVAFAGAGWYAANELAAGQLGFPLDDGWIHAQFASHLAAGGGFSFNAGEPSAGSTSPLWTLLLGACAWAGLHIVIAAKVLGATLTAVTAMLGAAIARRMSRSVIAGWVAGLALALSPRMTWASGSGMEVSLACALLLAALLVYQKSPRRPLWWSGLAGLAGIARPELLSLTPFLIAHRLLWREADSTEAFGGRSRDAMVATVAFVVLFAVYAAINNHGAGTILPSTFSAKSRAQGLGYALAALDVPELLRSISSRPIENASLLLRFFFDQSQFLFAAAIVGVPASLGLFTGVRAAPASGTVAAFVLGSALLMGAMAPDVPLYGQEGRYVLPFVVLLFVLGGVGFGTLASLTTRSWWVAGLAAVTLVRLASQDVQFAPRYAAQVANINRLHVEMGRWVAAHTPADALVATNDIGAVAYISGRRILDTEGLVTPGIIPFKAERRQLEFLESARPDLLIVFPEWYPHLVARSDLFTEIHRITVPRVSAAHDSLVVYRTPWTRPAVAAGPGSAR